MGAGEQDKLQPRCLHTNVPLRNTDSFDLIWHLPRLIDWLRSGKLQDEFLK